MRRFIHPIALLPVLCVLASPTFLAMAATPASTVVGSVTGGLQPILQSVVSRKTHGAAGDFDLPVDVSATISGAVSIEPRAAGTANTLVFRFDSAVATPGTVAVFDDANNSLAGASASLLPGNQSVAVTLPTVPDRSRVRVTLNNVGGTGLNVSAAIGFLLGDVSGATAVSAGSTSAVKARAGQVVDAGNFRYDINLSGSVSAADIAAVKSRSGTVLLPAPGSPWPAFGRDAQHNANSPVASQPLNRLRWTTPVDLAPVYSGQLLFAHYGPPVITARNTIVLPVKTGSAGGFRFEARNGANGALLWSANSDYILPAHFWVPSYNVTLTPANRVYAPGAGGKIYVRDNADSAAGSVQTLVFYGAGTYAGAPSVFDSTVYINTPLTTDTQGNIFFGYSVTGANPANLASGIARITPAGTATFIDAATMMGTAFARPVLNAAPALSADQTTLYMPVGTSAVLGGTQTPYLVAMDSTTLVKKASILLQEPSGATAIANENGTSSPFVAPDGDVYYGVLGSTGGAHSVTGWLLHFDGNLSAAKTPGAFGWDNTPSLVPAAMVPSYAGTSSYLLMTKYNSYIDGQHRIAILDPSQTQVDVNGGATVMKEILTLRSPTPDVNNPARVTEWCINTAAVDPIRKSVLVNNEDGYLYRWDLTTNQLAERIQLNSGIGQAYTATVIAPDGVVYAVNNAVLFSVGR